MKLTKEQADKYNVDVNTDWVLGGVNILSSLSKRDYYNCGFMIDSVVFKDSNNNKVTIEYKDLKDWQYKYVMNHKV